MTEPALIGVDNNLNISFYVYRYDDGSVQIRKPHDNEVAQQHGIHTINLTAAEAKSLVAILRRPAKPAPDKIIPSPRKVSAA